MINQYFYKKENNQDIFKSFNSKELIQRLYQMSGLGTVPSIVMNNENAIHLEQSNKQNLMVLSKCVANNTYVFDIYSVSDSLLKTSANGSSIQYLPIVKNHLNSLELNKTIYPFLNILIKYNEIYGNQFNLKLNSPIYVEKSSSFHWHNNSSNSISSKLYRYRNSYLSKIGIIEGNKDSKEQKNELKKESLPIPEPRLESVYYRMSDYTSKDSLENIYDLSEFLDKTVERYLINIFENSFSRTIRLSRVNVQNFIHDVYDEVKELLEGDITRTGEKSLLEMVEHYLKLELENLYKINEIIETKNSGEPITSYAYKELQTSIHISPYILILLSNIADFPLDSLYD